MPAPSPAALDQWLNDHESELLEDLRTLLRFPSVETEALPGAPFGQANRDALDFMLQRANTVGMSTRDLDGFAGYAEFGSGEPQVISLGHLDVVPVGNGWRFDPFGAEIEGDYLYARGAVDDKGPTMASFYAMRALKECGWDLPVRMRSVFGCDEESGFLCIAHYNKHEAPPTYGIAPDSGWPCFNVEKGISILEVAVQLPDDAGFKVRNVRGGERPNIVTALCVADLIGDAARLKEKIAGYWDRNIDVEDIEGGIRVKAIGKPAHGSTPHEGDNAAYRLFDLLATLAETDAAEDAFLALKSLCVWNGLGLNIALWDEPSGPLTSNVGGVQQDGDRLVLTINLRYPATLEFANILERVRARLAQFPTASELVSSSDSPSLYFPADHPLVKTIVDVYADVKGERLEPGSMGGGTYARAIANTVSVGTGWRGDGKAHEANERVKIAHLKEMARIYARILARLGEIAAS